MITELRVMDEVGSGALLLLCRLKGRRTDSVQELSGCRVIVPL